MNVIEFTIPGTPEGKGRPRSSSRIVAGRVLTRHITPEKTRTLETYIRIHASLHRPATPLCGPIALNLLFVFPIPPSWSKKRRAEAESWHMAHLTKPDIDNCTKAVMDALNKIYWNDDSQICQVTARKQYGDEPRTVISCWEFGRMEEANQWTR